VRIGGRDVQTDPAARGLIGLVSHQSLLYEDLTARENLRFAAALHGIAGAEQRVRDALDTAGLTAVADRRTGTFSRGMIQRLTIARATLHAPVLLLLDEPFTGLDAPAAQLLRRRMAAERAAGRAVLCVTHEPAEAWHEATRIVVLIAGKVVIDQPRPTDLERFRRDYQELLRQ
jgi:heme exporter protein A